MKLKTMLSKVSVFALAAVCCLSLAGCGSKYGYTGGTAATVNGTPIEEDTVTKYIEDFRTSSNLTSDEDWAAWLKESDQDPASIREQVINYYIQQELVRQAADENEIVVEQSAIDEQVDAMKKNYNSDKAWQDALAQSGVTEDQYRESIEIGLTSRQLQEAVVQEVDTSDDAGLLAFMNEYKDMINGSKRSSHILLEAGDEAKAEEIVTQLTSGQLDFATAAQMYSTDTGSARNGGDVGWNTINNFVDAYNNALDSIDLGQITLTVSDYGIHIILCTDVLNIEGEPTSLDAYPEEIVEYMRTIYGSQKQSEGFQEWLEHYQEESDIVINEMPSNVPYNIDLSQFNTDSEEGSEEGSDDEGSESEDSGSSSNEQQNLSAIGNDNN
ncbi:SurA N-terminal domain-containing protein [Anaerotardibacter muris]|uniref:SurA N-terminal domain-containing protein n=1 Tax=Anaerotardibacter muris TaxID=2941505 RepID=UPI00203DDB70|nr:SurA N-terminal domain-containing protein [Anaerotardibacter muris]